MTQNTTYNIFEEKKASIVLEVLNGRERFNETETTNILNNSITHLYLRNNQDIKQINEVFSKLDSKACYNFFSSAYGKSSISRYLENHPELENHFLGKPLLSEIVSFYSRNNLSDKMEKYLSSLYDAALEPLKYLEISQFIGIISGDNWKNLKTKHPKVIKDWDITYHQVPGNILQMVAKFNPSLYETIKQDFPNMDLYENLGKSFILSIGLGATNYDLDQLFKSEIEKLTTEELSSLIDGSISTQSKKLLIIDEIINKKGIDNLSFKERNFFEQHLNIFFDKIWLEENPLNRYQEKYTYLLKTSNDGKMGENTLYNILTMFGSLRHNSDNLEKRNHEVMYNTLKKFLDIIETNPHSKIDLIDILSNKDNPEFWLNKSGIADLLIDSPAVKVKSMIQDIEEYRDAIGYFHDIFLEKKLPDQIIDTIPTFNKLLQKIMQEQGINLTYSYSPGEDNSKIYVYTHKDLISKSLYSIDCLENLIPQIPQMNNIAFNKIFNENKILDWHVDNRRYSSNSTLETKEKAGDIILEKAKLNETFSSYKESKLAGYNFFQMLKLYTEDTLFDKGKLREILNEFPFSMVEMFNCSEANSFLFKNIERDFSPYLDLNSEMILKNMMDFKATCYLSEISHKCNNTSYRYNNGNSILHESISSGQDSTYIEIINEFPELNSITNNSKKLPIDLILSKMKLCTKDNTLKTYGSMLKASLRVKIDVPIPTLSKVYDNCLKINNKIINYEENWETILNKNIIERRIKDMSSEINKNTEDTIDWKL